jgi:hypothetical protein
VQEKCLAYYPILVLSRRELCAKAFRRTAASISLAARELIAISVWLTVPALCISKVVPSALIEMNEKFRSAAISPSNSSLWLNCKEKSSTTSSYS